MQYNQTLEYYERNAGAYISDMVSVDFTDVQNRFMHSLKGKKILDYGCGSGRDTLYFLKNGYNVDAMDGCREFCVIASQLTGIPVKHMLFQDLNEIDLFDGIWACSSILHVSKEDLKDVFARMIRALHKGGVIYMHSPEKRNGSSGLTARRSASVERCKMAVTRDWDFSCFFR